VENIRKHINKAIGRFKEVEGKLLENKILRKITKIL
jgi:hypothetical protein